MKTPYQRNGKKPIKADYQKEFGLYGMMLYRVDLALYEEARDARRQYKQNLKEQAKRAKK